MTFQQAEIEPMTFRESKLTKKQTFTELLKSLVLPTLK